MTAAGGAGPALLPPGSHVCWVVDDPAGYVDEAIDLLRESEASNEKPVAFGPEGSAALAAVGAAATMAADPRVAFLDHGPLDPDAMFAMFRDQSAAARAEGYAGLRLVADMDWLGPAGPSTASVVGFELLLDRVVGELGATVVCAYRRGSFDADAITGTLAVHPIHRGACEAPQFRLVAAEGGRWRLCGEVDVAVVDGFAAAFGAAASDGTCVVDVAELEFIDVAGMRVVAEAALDGHATVELRGASERLRRNWQLAGFDEVAPQVRVLA